MNKVNNPIRDIKIIEKDLENSFVGVLSFNNGKESVRHLPITFIYHHKNIYTFHTANDEYYFNLPYESPAIFTTIKSSSKSEKVKNKEFVPVYRFLSITIKGKLKNVDDPKVFDEIKQKYLAKYSNGTEEIIESSLSNLVIIDTEEINAFEEYGE